MMNTRNIFKPKFCPATAGQNWPSAADGGVNPARRDMLRRSGPTDGFCNSKIWVKEPVNAITHILGGILSIVALVVLVIQAATTQTVWHVVSFAIYGASLIALYTASSLYHALKVSEGKAAVLQRLDHAMIYFLIAGTYTPMCLVALRGGWGWSILGVVWGLAIAGIILKLSIRNPSPWVAAILFTFYILMGWCIVIAWAPLTHVLNREAVSWLVWGGIFYTVGAVIMNYKRLDFHPHFGAHELWHFFVMAGSFCHFWLMFQYI